MSMSLSLINIVSACGAVGSTLVGAVYTNFSWRVMPRLSSLPEADGMRTMQEFNRQAVQAPFMTIFFGTAVASIWKIVETFTKEERSIGDWLAASGGALYMAGMILTVVYNVPRNDLLAAVSPGTLDGSRAWQMFLGEWTSANSVRAVLSLAGALALGIGTFLNLTASGPSAEPQ